MRTLGSVAGLVCLLLAVTAHADTVYLKNGDTVWGSEVIEAGETVVVLRAGEKSEYPKSDVLRIERARLSIPRYYNAPDGGGMTVSGPPPGMPGPGQMPGPPGMPPPPGMSGGPAPAFGAPGGMPSPPGMPGAPAPPAPYPGASAAAPSPGGAAPPGAPPQSAPPSGSAGSSSFSAPAAGPIMGPVPPIGYPGGSARDRDVPPPPSASR